MHRNWSDEELQQMWHLCAAERKLIYRKQGVTRLGFAVLLKCFQVDGHFPSGPVEIPIRLVNFIAEQVDVPADEWPAYPWSGRSLDYHRAEIRSFCGFEVISRADMKRMKRWLIADVIPLEHRDDQLLDIFQQRCKQSRLEPPTLDQALRVIRSAIATHDARFRDRFFRRFHASQLSFMDALLIPIPSTPGEAEWTLWQKIKGEPGPVGLESMKEAAQRLDIICGIDLPADAFKSVPAKLINRFAKQAAVEEPFELRRHKPAMRCVLQASYMLRRREVLTDHCIDVLIEIIQKFTKKAQKRVDEGIGAALNKATRKLHKLYSIAKASISLPKGIVEDVVFPAASKDWLLALIEEVESNTVNKATLIATIQRSYRSHYRRLLPDISRHLEFKTTSQDQSIITALAIIQQHSDYKHAFYPDGLHIPIKGIVPSDWRMLVIDGTGSKPKINRIAYEICVLMTLRDKLRCREVWVAHGRRYRNPEDDLPQDFESKKAHYYAVLNIANDPKAYVRALKEEMTTALKELDRTLPDNPKVAVVQHKDGHRFSISPLAALDDPKNLDVLKHEVFGRWGGTNLLDVLKETDLRVHFTRHFRSGSGRTNLEQNTLRRRLLLCLFGMGTNTGIKNMEQGRQEEYKELLYVRRRYISLDGLREAIAHIANATLKIRNPNIWGENTTACASDSKQFSAWDQNLLTEWHMRYGGRGVMVYWHVEKNSTCIYSQFKRVSSSEVASMINGVLRHCTEMEVDRQYVDTHGQSTLAFGICRLLGFDLMPRIKGINRMRMHRSMPGLVLPNLDKKVMMPGFINWDLIETHFDTLIKHVVSLRLGIADAESLLRRFTKNSTMHPAYKAFTELGKVIKVIFACRYFMSEDLRREIHQGLNVVESWNSTNGFIYYGNDGEMASNKQEDLEMGLLSLHLLQASLVYINTMMIQRVLQDPAWAAKMTDRDLAALSPLLTQHINKYGRFELDFRKRLQISA